MNKLQATGFRFAFIAIMFNIVTWVLPVLSAHAQIDFISICTSQGLEVIKVSSSDNIDDDVDGDSSVSQNCSFCHLQSAVYVAPMQKRLNVQLYSQAKHYGRYENVVLSVTDPERDIPVRAPPFIS